MITGYFLFPVTKTFFSKRLTRVLIPFIIWCVLYALRGFMLGQTDLQTAFINILKIPVNYGTEIGHLWFVYMLIGIYLFAPILSPWIAMASKQNMQLYLWLWAFTLCLPYIHLIFPEVLGDAFWNHTPLYYYFSGFLGYVVLANYIKRFHNGFHLSQVLLGVVLIVVGYAITAYGFLHRLSTEKYIMQLELTWGFETINVAMMAAGLFLVCKNIQGKDASKIQRFISHLSVLSYGVYLAHIMILNVWYPIINPVFSTAAITIPIIAVLTFVSSFLIIKILSYLPASKYLIG